MEPVPHTLVAINQRNIEARAHIASAPALIIPSIYRYKRSVKIWKPHHKTSVAIWIFLQCRLPAVATTILISWSLSM